MHWRSDPQLCYIVDDVTARLLVSFLLFGLLFGILLSFVHFDKRSCRYVGEVFCKHKHYLVATVFFFFDSFQHTKHMPYCVRRSNSTGQVVVECLNVIVNAVRLSENRHFFRSDRPDPILFDVCAQGVHLRGKNLSNVCRFEKLNGESTLTMRHSDDKIPFSPAPIFSPLPSHS